MIRAVSGHHLDHLCESDVALALGMVGTLLQIPRLESSQEPQSVVTIQAVERDLFRGRSFDISKMVGPLVLVDRRNHGFLVRQDLPHAVRIHDLHIG